MITTPAEYGHPNYVPDAVTALGGVDAGRAILVATTRLTGRTPSMRALAILIGQSALETGDWRSIHCFNFGNAKSGVELPHTYFKCGELLADPNDPKRRARYFKFAAPHEPLPEGTPFNRSEHTRQTRFRAFESADAGATYHMRLITSGRYAPAYERAMAGDAVGFSELLHLHGYYTADVSSYTQGVVWRTKQCEAIARQVLGLAPALPATVRLGSRGEEVVRLQSLLGVPADGVFGAVTLSAVRTWQGQHGLLPDGVVGPVTWEALLHAAQSAE